MLAAAAAVSLAGCGTGGGGDDATEALLLETCAPGGAVPLEVRVCRCAFERLAERYDADELARLDQQLRDDPETIPEPVQEAALACTFEAVAPPEAPTTTTAAPDAEDGDEPDGGGGAGDRTTTTARGRTTTTDREP